MFRIGIDFDNTVACYDRAFISVAAILNIDLGERVSTKTEVKESLLRQPEGDLAWQRLQGQVYGKYMDLAEIFPGFFEFLYLSKLRGHSVVIVSHKSEFGHFDEDRIPLREQALRWMRANRFFEKNGLSLSEEEVFFESTREKKIHRIRELGCTHFIDDLSDVFEEPLFPKDVCKIWFRPGSRETGGSQALSPMSWKEINCAINSAWTEEEVSKVAQITFPGLGIREARLINGRGNSRVYELSGMRKNYALKVYPDRQFDPRPRLQTEFAACRLLHSLDYPVMEAVATDENLGWGVYQWIQGSEIKEPDEYFLEQALEFVKLLSNDRISIEAFNQFPDASEACLSGAEIARQIDSRLHALMAVGSNDLDDYLRNEFVPRFEFAVHLAKQAGGNFFNTVLPRPLQILNPSDFGSHNALRDERGRIVFIDFEYFGWDDPVKLISDFYWHPGMNLSQEMRSRWIALSSDIFQTDPTFSQRLKSYLPLYGLRWCMILLNEFLKRGLAHRINADGEKASDKEALCSRQLHKSKMLLEQIREVLHAYGSAIKKS